MSYQRASKDSHNDKTLTSLVLIGTRDCRPDLPLRAQGPDLWVKGGSIIEKTLCVLGNVVVDGLIIGNLCGDVYTENIIAKELQDGINVVGNLIIDEDFFLFGSIRTNCIADESGENLQPINIKADLDLTKHDVNNVGNLMVCHDVVVGNSVCVPLLTCVDKINGTGNLSICNNGEAIDIQEDLDLNKHDVGNVGNLMVEHVMANSVCTPLLSCVQKISGPGDLLICNDGDLILQPTRDVILSNVALDFDLTKSILSNVRAVEAAAGCPLELSTDDGFKVVISGGDGLDLDGRNLCNVGEMNIDGKLTAETICVLGNLIADNVTSNTTTISEKLTAEDGCFNGDLIVLGNLVAMTGGNSMIGDINADKITTKDLCVTNSASIKGLSATGGATVSGGLMVNGATTIMGKLTVTGAIDPTVLVLEGQMFNPWGNISGNDGAIWVQSAINPSCLVFTDSGNTDNVIFYANGALPMTGPLIQTDTTQCGNINSGAVQIAGGMGIAGNIHSGGYVNADVGFHVAGIQVIGQQEGVIADVGVLSADNLIDQTLETPTTTILNIGNVLSTFDILGNSFVEVTDLQTRIDDANLNFSSLTEQINNIVADIGTIRTQFNMLLQALRNHGLIDT